MRCSLFQELTSVQPAGPYLLAGYSFGACVAIEMCKQLISIGQPVSQLFLLDGSHTYVSASTQQYKNKMATGSEAEKETEALRAFCSLYTAVDCKQVNSTLLGFFISSTLGDTCMRACSSGKHIFCLNF